MFSPYFGGDGGSGVGGDVISATSTVNTTTTSTTPVALNAMTLTPAAGTYMVFFSTYTVCNTYDHVFVQLYIDNTSIPAEVREGTGREATTLGTNPVFNPTAIIAPVTVNGAQAVNIRWWTNSGATGTCHHRSLHLLRIG